MTLSCTNCIISYFPPELHSINCELKIELPMVGMQTEDRCLCIDRSSHTCVDQHTPTRKCVHCVYRCMHVLSLGQHINSKYINPIQLVRGFREIKLKNFIDFFHFSSFFFFPYNLSLIVYIILSVKLLFEKLLCMHICVPRVMLIYIK